MTKMNKPKILLFDLETSHNLVLSFGLRKQYIPHDNIIIDRHIFCVSYKWLGQKQVKTISILDDPKRFKKDIHDDYYVVNEFRKVIEQASAIVAHNGNNFDTPMYNTRLIACNLPPLPKIISLDTLPIARKYFKFNNNKLDYLSKFLGHQGKMENPTDLWQKCFFGDKKALKHMAKYNRQDIEALELVFNKLMPFVKNSKLNMGLFLEGARCTNPICSGTNLEWRGWNYTRTGKYRRCVCRDCSTWSDERKCVPNYKPKLK